MPSTPTARQWLRAPGGTLGRDLAEHLRNRIIAGEYPPGTRLPSETAVSEEYGVSRVTARTATKLLESQGLVTVRHGSGTFVADFGGQVRSGIQELRSISATIEEMGMSARTERHRLDHRRATADEVEKLDTDADAYVLAFERAIFGDDVVMAYSYDVLPAHIVPNELVGDLGTGSIFAVLDDLGRRPVRALSELHAVHSHEIGWGPDRPADGLFLLLDQVHQDQQGQVVAYSKTYFVEGRFQFTILRTR